MDKYHEGLPVRWYDRPGTITTRTVCVPSGLLPSGACPGSRQRNEIFLAGTEPDEADNIWQAFDIDSTTGQLASPTTPPDQIQTRVYQILPQEAADWVRENNIAQPPEEQRVVRLEDVDPDASIIDPPPYSYVSREPLSVIGNSQAGWYQLSVGIGLEPVDWTPLGPERSDNVTNSTLDVLQTDTLSEGLHTLRLTVRRYDGTLEWRTPFNVDKTPPTLVISEPKPDTLFVMEDDEQINVNVLANDTWAMDRVEFYMDDVLFATSTVGPYNERWTIRMRDLAQIENGGARNWLGFESDDPDVRPGRELPFADGFSAIQTSEGVYFEGHTIEVYAYDRAGNLTISDEIRVYVRHKQEEE